MGRVPADEEQTISGTRLKDSCVTDKLIDCPDCDGEGVFESGGVEIRCCHCKETGTVPSPKKLKCFFGLHTWEYKLKKGQYIKECEWCNEWQECDR